MTFNSNLYTFDFNRELARFKPPLEGNKEMVAKVVAVVSALVVGMVLTSTPSHASTQTQKPVSSTKGKIIIMAGPPVCCGVTLS